MCLQLPRSAVGRVLARVAFDLARSGSFGLARSAWNAARPLGTHVALYFVSREIGGIIDGKAANRRGMKS
jgi:hypothetical protein